MIAYPASKLLKLGEALLAVSILVASRRTLSECEAKRTDEENLLDLCRALKLPSLLDLCRRASSFNLACHHYVKHIGMYCFTGEFILLRIGPEPHAASRSGAVRSLPDSQLIIHGGIECRNRLRVQKQKKRMYACIVTRLHIS